MSYIQHDRGFLGPVLLMTLTDILIPVYYWFKSGFGEISVPIAFVNMAILIVTILTVKGFFITMWLIPIIGLTAVMICILVGWFFQHYAITSRTATMINQKMNPEIKQISDDIKLMKKQMGLK